MLWSCSTAGLFKVWRGFKGSVWIAQSEEGHSVCDSDNFAKHVTELKLGFGMDR